MASAAKAGGTKMPETSAPVAGHRLLHGVEHRPVEMDHAALAGRDAADDVGAHLQGLLGMEGGVLTGEALDDDLGIFVDQDAHTATPPNARTALAAASSRLRASI